MNVIILILDELVEGRSYQSEESVSDFNEPNTKDSNQAFIINLEIRNKVLQSAKSVKDNLERFLSNIMVETNGRLFSNTDGENINVALAVNDNGLL